MPDIADPQFTWASPAGSGLLPDKHWKQWLFDPGSLTQLLIRKSDNRFKVELVAEEWIEIERADLRSQFGPVSQTHRFWSRKVILMGNNRPWVMAHTLVPEHSLFSPLKQVLELNTKPLGEYLFSHPDLIRTGMDITSYGVNCWARRSLFFLFCKPVMVAEFFLPALLED
ncbi:MAG: chorismate lyase [Pseudohongiella sp.]|nr:chorismate lyase [Pseudohongiella sp.]